MDELIKLFDTNFNDIIIAISAFAFYVLLGLEDNITSKMYLKKFILLLYSLFTIMLIFFNIPILWIILMFTIIFFVSSLNITHEISSIEKNLSKLDLVIFSFIRWLFHTKALIFFISSVVSILIHYKFQNYYITTLILVMGMLVHQISFAKDTFNYENFDYLYNKLTNNSGFLLSSSNEDKFFYLLSFILYVEDRDYFDRKSLIFEITPVMKRNKYRYWQTIKKSKWRLFRYQNLKRLRKKYWRGYSSIEMQVVRRTVLKEDSYQNLFRRKVLIEIIYTKYFHKAVTKMIRRYNVKAYDKDKELTDELIFANLKTLFLLYYYNEIKGKPETIEEFVKNNDSRLKLDTYKILEENFMYQKQDEYYTYLLKKNWEKFNQIHYLGRVVMKFSEIKYGNDGSIYYEKSEGKKKFIEYSGSTKPIISPNHKNIIYISPCEWETKSSLYLYNLVTQNKKVLIEPSSDNNIPKDAIWISDNIIAIIIGYAYGTVETGGNIYLYNLEKEKYYIFKEYSDKIQINAFILFSDNTLSVSGIKYIDNQYNESTRFKENLEIPF